MSVHDEIICMVLKRVEDCQDLLHLSMTCKRLHALVMGCQDAWRQLYEAAEGSEGDFSLPPRTSWHEAFRQHHVFQVQVARLKRRVKSGRITLSIQVRV